MHEARRSSRPTIRTAGRFVRSVAEGLFDHGLSRHAAALAFYALVSLTPLSVFLLALAGVFYEEQTARLEIVEQIEIQLGAEAAGIVDGVLQSVVGTERDLLSGVVGVVAALFGMTAVFVQLQDALNEVFEVPPDERPIADLLRRRLLSFLMVVAMGLLLIASLAAGTALSLLRGTLGPLSHVAEPLGLAISANEVISFLLLTLLFALVYWILPDADLDFRDALVGGVVTSLIFTGGRVVVALYLSSSDRTSAYGASGSLVLFLLWIYFSSLIFLLGAEITRVYAGHRGRLGPPAKARRNREQTAPASRIRRKGRP